MRAPNPASRPALAPSGGLEGYAMAYYWSRWAAIAYSTSTGRFGYSYMQDDQASAERVARASCGASDALIVAKGTLPHYLALAIAGDRGWGSGVNANQRYAEREALKNCPRPGAHIAAVIHPTSGAVFLEQGEPPRASATPAAAPPAMAARPARMAYFQPADRRAAWRWGAPTGLIAAIAVVAALELSRIWGLGSSAAVIASRGQLTLVLAYLVALLCPLAGFLAARETGRLSAAALAAFVAGAIWALGLAAGMGYDHIATPSHDSIVVIILAYGAGALVLMPVGGAIAAALGLVGGLVGRGLHRTPAR